MAESIVTAVVKALDSHKLYSMHRHHQLGHLPPLLKFKLQLEYPQESRGNAFHNWLAFWGVCTCLRLPFVKMVYSIAINPWPAVNVPSKVDTICNILLRLPSHLSELVPLKLKRKLAKATTCMTTGFKFVPTKGNNTLLFHWHHQLTKSQILKSQLRPLMKMTRRYWKILRYQGLNS
jgi:hypothetical protein